MSMKILANRKKIEKKKVLQSSNKYTGQEFVAFAGCFLVNVYSTSALSKIQTLYISLLLYRYT